MKYGMMVMFCAAFLMVAPLGTSSDAFADTSSQLKKKKKKKKKGKRATKAGNKPRATKAGDKPRATKAGNKPRAKKASKARKVGFKSLAVKVCMKKAQALCKGPKLGAWARSLPKVVKAKFKRVRRCLAKKRNKLPKFCQKYLIKKGLLEKPSATSPPSTSPPSTSPPSTSPPSTSPPSTGDDNESSDSSSTSTSTTPADTSSCYSMRTGYDRSDCMIGLLDSTFATKINAVIKELRDAGWKAVVHESRRNKAQQEKKCRDRVSDTMCSHHLCGLGADIIDKRYAWGNSAAAKTSEAYKMSTGKHAFWTALGTAGKKQGMTWGGDWRKPDVAHVQYGDCSLTKARVFGVTNCTCPR